MVASVGSRFMAASTSTPFIRGIIRSSSTSPRSWDPRIAASASIPSLAVTAGTSYRPSTTVTISRMSGSSSTTSTVRCSSLMRTRLRDPDHEARATIVSRLHVYRATVPGDDRAHDEQAQTKTAVVAHRHRALERPEDRLALGRADPETAVADHQRRPAIGGGDGDLDRPTEPELEGVGEQVGDDLVDPDAVPATDHGVRCLDRHRGARPLDVRLEPRHHLA